MSSIPLGDGSKQVVLKTLAYSFCHGCFVYVGSKENPSAADWDKYTDFVVKWQSKGTLGLVYEQGGVPNAVQRKQLHDATQGYKNTVAVMSNSAIGRGVVTMLSWINPGYRAFSHDEVRKALNFLGLYGVPAKEIEAELNVLKRRLG